MAFLTEKGNLASAYKLLGQILEMQQQPALDAYKRSLDLDSSQNDVLLKGIVYAVFLQRCLSGIDVKLLWVKDDLYTGNYRCVFVLMKVITRYGV